MRKGGLKKKKRCATLREGEIIATLSTANPQACEGLYLRNISRCTTACVHEILRDITGKRLPPGLGHTGIKVEAMSPCRAAGQVTQSGDSRPM